MTPVQVIAFELLRLAPSATPTEQLVVVLAFSFAVSALFALLLWGLSGVLGLVYELIRDRYELRRLRRFSKSPRRNRK